MFNPARLAAEFSGRPLLLREASVPALARQLGFGEVERGSPFANLMGRARRALAGRGDADADRTEPQALCPNWLGEPEAVGYGWVLIGGVGVLDIRGPLLAEGFGWGDAWYHGYDSLRRAYEEMLADARVGAIWEVVRSPGGVVDAGLPELAALKRESRAAAGGKPIHTFARDAYSAAYWLPSGSDRIVAARESGVGSIGAVVTWCGMAGMLENDGLEVRAFKFGARKTDGSPFEPLSDTAEATLQAEIDQCGRWFVADVVAGRPNLSEEAVLATQAGCYFGDSDDPALSGLALGLVDEIATERAAFAAVQALAQTRLASPPNPQPAADPAASREKETEMKRSAVLAAARKAGLSDDEVNRLSAELPEDDDTDTETDDDEETAETDDDQDETAETDDDEDQAAEAARISRSKEASTHPAMALAAIAQGATLAQFRAMAAAAPASGGGRLAEAMKSSRRLGSDGPKGAAGLAGAMAARAEANRAKTPAA